MLTFHKFVYNFSQKLDETVQQRSTVFSVKTNNTFLQNLAFFLAKFDNLRKNTENVSNNNDN